MPHLRMHQPMERTPMDHSAATDAGADSQIDERIVTPVPAPYVASAMAAALTSVSTATGTPKRSGECRRSGTPARRASASRGCGRRWVSPDPGRSGQMSPGQAAVSHTIGRRRSPGLTSQSAWWWESWSRHEWLEASPHRTDEFRPAGLNAAVQARCGYHGPPPSVPSTQVVSPSLCDIIKHRSST